jgi:hypothetical protein
LILLLTMLLTMMLLMLWWKIIFFYFDGRTKSQHFGSVRKTNDSSTKLFFNIQSLTGTKSFSSGPTTLLSFPNSALFLFYRFVLVSLDLTCWLIVQSRFLSFFCAKLHCKI